MVGQAPQIYNLNGADLRILIIKTRWHENIVNVLVDGTINSLMALKVERSDIIVKSVSGSYELPFAADKLIKNSNKLPHIKFDAVICIGILLKGETMHFEYISQTVALNLTRVSLDNTTPIIYGVLNCLNLEQAKERAGLNADLSVSQKHINHGESWGAAAVEMALLEL